MQTIDFPLIAEDDYTALMNQRSQLVGRLAAIEEILREKYGSGARTI